MIVPIIRAASICAALYFSYRIGFEAKRSEEHGKTVMNNALGAAEEMLNKAKQELAELEEEFARVTRTGAFSDMTDWAREEIITDLTIKIGSKKTHITNLESTFNYCKS